MVRNGRMPQPSYINSKPVFDRLKLDQAFEALDKNPETNPWDDI
jgi:hypothetical protein